MNWNEGTKTQACGSRILLRFSFFNDKTKHFLYILKKSLKPVVSSEKNIIIDNLMEKILD